MLTIFCISVIISVSYFSYMEMDKNILTSHEREIAASENLFSKSSIYIHRGLKLWDSSYDEQLHRDMQKLIAIYNSSEGDLSRINLNEARKTLDPIYQDRIDLYFINSSGVIELTTDRDEYLMDFKQWPDFYEKIKEMIRSDDFVPDEIVKGFIPGAPLRKFVYQPTPDHTYLAQISLNVQNISVGERAELSYGTLASYVINQSPGLKKLHVMSSIGTLILGKKDYPGGKPDPETRNITSRVFETKVREVIPDSRNQTITTYIFVPNAVKETPSARYMNLVGKFVFSTEEMNSHRTNNLILHGLLIILGSLFAILIAGIIINRLTSPLNKLVHEIDLISEGNLDQSISPAWHPELGRIADAVRKMVDQITGIIRDLQASEARFKSLFNTATDAIIIIDQDHIIDANPAAYALFGMQGTSLAGASLPDICPQISEFIMDMKMNQINDDSETGSGTDINDAYIRVNIQGTGVRILNIRPIPLGPGEQALFQVQIRDVTKRIEMEEAIQELNAHLEQQVKERTAVLEATIADLDAFTYTVSHDLRAPLRAIDGNTYILDVKGAGVIPPELTRHLTKIHDNIKRMDHLIDDLLKFSRMSRKPLEKTKVDMNELVREVIEELTTSLSGHEISLEVSDLPHAYGDTALIRQVLVNLISNAMKFGRSGTLNVIRIFSHIEEGKTWYLIQDTGIGFDIQFVDRIFEVFLQLNPAGVYGGTGVGLAIVKRIIFRHKGEIKVESEEGVGSTFRFTLGDEKTDLPEP